MLKYLVELPRLTRPLINQTILTTTTGATIGAFYDGDKSLTIRAAFSQDEQNRFDLLSSLPIWAPALNKSVPLGTVFSNIETLFEDNIIMRRDRSRVITVASETKLNENTDAMLKRIAPKIEAFDYSLEWGGEKEMSTDAMNVQ